MTTTRSLVKPQLDKRQEIRAMKEAQPGLSVRTLAGMFHASPRTVVEALAREVTEWQASLSTLVAGPVPTILTPSIPLVPLVPRDYQASAAKASIARNTLLVLPTGLGKTIVALLHVESILGGAIPAGKAAVCIMMAPTKALLVQHRDLFQRHLRVADAGLAIVDGETEPDNRKRFYASLAGRRVVLFMTPQTVLHDLEKGRLSRACIIDLVVDEAHHATQGDPYALVYSHLREHGVSPRVLAMTASPGETEMRIVDVCQNLGINPVDSIIKQREDPDVKPHVFRLDVKRYAVDLTPEYEQVRGMLVAVLREPCAWLESAGITGNEIGTDSLKLPSMQALQVLMEQHAPAMPVQGLEESEGDPALDPDPPSDMDLEQETINGPPSDVDLEQATSNDAQPVQPASPGAVVSKLALATRKKWPSQRASVRRQ
jgi:hypothetical protein